MSGQRLSADGRRVLEAFEGCRLAPFRDSGGKWTIGRGHLMQPTDPRDPITQQEADALFDLDLLRFEDGVAELVHPELRQHEFDALVIFAFNVGLDIDSDQVAEGLGDSTLLKYVNRENFAAAACEFPKWCLVNGKRDAGVLWRRCSEQAIFLLADYSRLP